MEKVDKDPRKRAEPRPVAKAICHRADAWNVRSMLHAGDGEQYRVCAARQPSFRGPDRNAGVDEQQQLYPPGAFRLTKIRKPRIRNSTSRRGQADGRKRGPPSPPFSRCSLPPSWAPRRMKSLSPTLTRLTGGGQE